MRAIDTNVLVRFLINDDAAQAARAREAIKAGDIFVRTTVILESEWVLRRGYKLPPARIVAALRDVLDLPGLTVEQPLASRLALDWAEQGMDFADALHLAGAEGCTAFLSFDRKLAKLAKGRCPIPVEEP